MILGTGSARAARSSSSPSAAPTSTSSEQPGLWPSVDGDVETYEVASESM